MAKTFIEYTIDKIYDAKPSSEILIISPEFNLTNVSLTRQNLHLTTNDANTDLAQWISNFRNSENFMFFDYIIMSRVFEHLPFRECDYYLYMLSSIMEPDAELILTVPDMKRVFQDYIKELEKENPDHHKLLRYNIEIFSEGNNVWDRHSIFTSQKSIEYHLRMEEIFRIKEMTRMKIDTNWIDFLEFKLVKK